MRKGLCLSLSGEEKPRKPGIQLQAALPVQGVSRAERGLELVFRVRTGVSENRWLMFVLQVLSSLSAAVNNGVRESLAFCLSEIVKF